MSCRILYVIGELHTGGAERQLSYLLRSIDRARYRPAVAVWNYREQDLHVRPLRDLGIPIFSFTQTSRIAKLSAFRRLVKKLQPELIHSYSFYTNFAAQWAAVATRSIPIGSVRSDFVWAMREAGPVLGRLSGRWPCIQICNSFAAVESAKSSGSFFIPRQLPVVRNGIDLERFRSFPPPTKEPVILGIGYLLPVKRWDCLLAAAEKLKMAGLQFSVKIAGDGPLQPVLEKQAVQLGIADRVQFVGHSDDIPGLISEATLVVHTAASEGCPNSVMEAMACGRAVVATDAGDVSKLIRHGETGFIVAHDQNAKLVEYIGKLIADRDLCRSMGRAARAVAERECGLDHIVDETFAVYRSAGWRQA